MGGVEKGFFVGNRKLSKETHGGGLRRRRT